METRWTPAKENQWAAGKCRLVLTHTHEDQWHYWGFWRYSYDWGTGPDKTQESILKANWDAAIWMHPPPLPVGESGFGSSHPPGTISTSWEEPGTQDGSPCLLMVGWTWCWCWCWWRRPQRSLSNCHWYQDSWCHLWSPQRWAAGSRMHAEVGSQYKVDYHGSGSCERGFEGPCTLCEPTSLVHPSGGWPPPILCMVDRVHLDNVNDGPYYMVISLNGSQQKYQTLTRKLRMYTPPIESSWEDPTTDLKLLSQEMMYCKEMWREKDALQDAYLLLLGAFKIFSELPFGWRLSWYRCLLPCFDSCFSWACCLYSWSFSGKKTASYLVP